MPRKAKTVFPFAGLVQIDRLLATDFLGGIDAEKPAIFLGDLNLVPGGSLYPALTRLEKQGLVSSRWRAGDGGPGRRYYRLTAAGQRQLATDIERWDSSAATVAGLLRQAATA